MGVYDSEIILTYTSNMQYDVLQPKNYHCNSYYALQQRPGIRDVCWHMPVLICPVSWGIPAHRGSMHIDIIYIFLSAVTKYTD